jgi:glycosyltransferase involved in cell wall biosynthesis
MYAQISDYKLLIVGEGSERKKFESLINRLNLNSKIFLEGRKTNVFEYYNRAKIFVLTSKHEFFSNVILETMSYGCAVVSFDCPYGPGEIIENEKNGILVENQNIDELAKNLQRLIDNKKLRDKLSKEAIKVREKYDIKKIANEWDKLIKEVIDK